MLIRAFALALGLAYLAGAVAGLVFPSPVFGLFAVNAAHSLFHLAIGVVLVAAVAFTPLGANSARTATAAVGLLFCGLALFGFIWPDVLDSLVVINLNDNLLHLATGVVATAVGLMSDPA